MMTAPRRLFKIERSDGCRCCKTPITGGGCRDRKQDSLGLHRLGFIVGTFYVPSSTSIAETALLAVRWWMSQHVSTATKYIIVELIVVLLQGSVACDDFITGVPCKCSNGTNSSGTFRKRSIRHCWRQRWNVCCLKVHMCRGRALFVKSLFNRNVEGHMISEIRCKYQAGTKNKTQHNAVKHSSTRKSTTLLQISPSNKDGWALLDCCNGRFWMKSQVWWWNTRTKNQSLCQMLTPGTPEKCFAVVAPCKVKKKAV